MKKLMIIAVSLLAAIGMKMSADERVSYEQLPQAAQTFVSKYFDGDAISVIEREHKPFKTEYEVKFASGAEADFTGDGAWREVKAAHGCEVPAGIIPSGISKYVKQQYAGKKIEKIKHDRRGYEVELSGDIDLEFDANGHFIRVDR